LPLLLCFSSAASSEGLQASEYPCTPKKLAPNGPKVPQGLQVQTLTT
jgi:hypothetical protein